MITLAHEMLAWIGLLALRGHDARRWEPKRLLLRIFSIAGTLARRSRQTWLRLSGTAPWTPLLVQGLKQLWVVPAVPTPADRATTQPDDPETRTSLEPAPPRPRRTCQTPGTISVTRRQHPSGTAHEGIEKDPG